MLIILQELMHRTFVEIEGRAPKRLEIPKPCDHFDLIAGTGTGGLIAIMLGRLRLDIDTCKNVYVRMTKRVFETDKTIAGIPYRSTLFKASKLEEAIRECVREHTIYEDEGNDGEAAAVKSPMSPRTLVSASTRPYRSHSNASRYSQIGGSPYNPRNSLALRWGDPNAKLYDGRENRTKTAVTAVFKNGKKAEKPTVLLRSYESRKESALEPDCTIWQAGRATSATALAFKPITIGTSTFLDEGPGRYNPAPMVLDEAVINEWPGRDVGVFISIGTGKRPAGTNTQQHLWWEGFVTSNIGDFAEARRRLVSKIEGCEETHQFMLKQHLTDCRVQIENYYRFNVEVGVGEFGMNEWNRLAEISSNTRMYLAKTDVTNMNVDAAAKMSRIHRAKIRWERQANGEPAFDQPPPTIPQRNEYQTPTNPMAVELPAEDVYIPPMPQGRPNSEFLSPTGGFGYNDFHRRSSSDEKIAIISHDEYAESANTDPGPGRRSRDIPTPPYRRSGELTNPDGQPLNGSPRRSGETPRPSGDAPRRTPPPLPPKTPLPYPEDGRPQAPAIQSHPAFRNQAMGVPLPYPDTDAPPPAVNKATKPEFGVR